MKKKKFLVLLIAMLVLLQGISVSAAVHSNTSTNVTDTGSFGSLSLVEYALKWVGNENIPYVWGGGRGIGITLESLAENSITGTDCSGYVSLVYAHKGLSIPNQSELIYNKAKKVFYDQSQAVPGDLCWWDGHIAIYIGNNKIVHTNTRVKPNNLIHITELGKDYPTPSAYLRMVDNVEVLGNVAGSTEQQIKSAKSSGSVSTESDLTGMPTKSSLLFEQKQLSLKSKNDLSQGDQERLQYLKESLENKNVSLADGFYVVSIFIGIVLAFYSVLLLIAIIFDMTNTFIDMSLVKILSLGRWEMLRREEALEGNMKLGYSKERGFAILTMGMMFIRIAIMFFISLCLIQGWLLNYIAYVIGKILY